MERLECGGVTLSPQESHPPQEEGVSGPNVVQQAIIFWTFQLSAYTSRVRGVVGGAWQGVDDPFAPIIHHLFNKATISAPLLW